MSRMMMRLRRAETNKSLLIALGVVAVLAVGFWGYRLMTSEKPAPVQVSAEPVTFYCYDCKKTFEVPSDQAAGLKTSDGKYDCTMCKKHSAIKGFGPSSRIPQQP